MEEVGEGRQGEGALLIVSYVEGPEEFGCCLVMVT